MNQGKQQTVARVLKLLLLFRTSSLPQAVVNEDTKITSHSPWKRSFLNAKYELFIMIYSTLACGFMPECTEYLIMELTKGNLPGITTKDPWGSMATRQALRIEGESVAEIPHIRHTSLSCLLIVCSEHSPRRILQSEVKHHSHA